MIEHTFDSVTHMSPRSTSVDAAAAGSGAGRVHPITAAGGRGSGHRRSSSRPSGGRSSIPMSAGGVRSTAPTGRAIPHTALEQLTAACDTAVAALAAQLLDPATLHTLPATALKPLALRLQGMLDQLAAAQGMVIHEGDRSMVWKGTGARDMAGWLADATNTNYRDTAQRHKLGAALDQSPTLRTALTNGDVSAATATQLHDAVVNPPANATTADLDELIDFVAGASPRQAATTVEHWKTAHQAPTAEQLEQRRYQRRSVRRGPALDGMVDTHIILPVLQADMLHQTLHAIAGPPAQHDTRTTEQRNADALIQLCAAYANGEVTGGRERPTILVTIPATTLAGLDDNPCTTANGDPIPAHVVRHLAESAILQRVVHAGSVILNMGQRVRTATEHQYKALITRDGGCRWPGCNIPAAWCEIDHLTPWQHGGATDIDNLVMWCSHHHHERHLYTVHGDAIDLEIELPDGTRMPCPPKGVIGTPRPTRRTGPPPAHTTAA